MKKCMKQGTRKSHCVSFLMILRLGGIPEVLEASTTTKPRKIINFPQSWFGPYFQQGWFQKSESCACFGCSFLCLCLASLPGSLRHRLKGLGAHFKVHWVVIFCFFRLQQHFKRCIHLKANVFADAVALVLICVVHILKFFYVVVKIASLCEYSRFGFSNGVPVERAEIGAQIHDFWRLLGGAGGRGEAC